MIMLYNPVKVNVPSRYHERIKKALEKKGKVSVKINLTVPEKNDTLLLTRGQISKMERAALLGKKSMTIRMSVNQVRGNVKYEGGFLSLIIAAIASAIAAITAAAPVVVAGVTAVIPAIATGAATALGAVGVEEIITAAKGSGLYFRKNGMSVKLEPVEGGGLFLSPYQGVQQQETLGHGLQLKHEGKLYGNLEKSPWLREQVPIINVLL